MKLVWVPHADDVAPDGAGYSLGLWFYNDVAPTALPAKKLVPGLGLWPSAVKGVVP
jgi:hypothetical protein